MTKESETHSKREADANQSALRHRLRAQWLLLTMALAILAGVFVYYGFTAHSYISNQEQSRLQTQARVIALNIENQLNATNLALTSVINDLTYLRAHENIKLTNRRLQALADAMPGVRTMLVLDRNGTVVASSREAFIGKNFSLRNYYQAALQRGDSTLLYVSPPIKSILGQTVLNLSRIIPASDGTFGGVAVAALDPEYFKVLLNSVLYSPDMWSAINHGDGIRFMLVPEQNKQTEKNLALSGTFFSRHRESGRVESILTGKSVIGPSERIMALRTVQSQELKLDKPLYVSCSRDYAAIYENWRSSALEQAVVFVLISTAAVFGLVLLQRRQRELAFMTAQAHELTTLRLNLMEYSETHDLQELLRKALDEVCRLSSSPIGFYHFVETDQQTLSLQAWSTRTLKEFCTAEGHGFHYPIEKTGVWADCVRQRKPLIQNDYASSPNKKGLPDGHAPVIRELVVPIFRAELVVAIMGVGNKPADYTVQDTELVTYLADVVWEITERKRNEEERHKLNASIRETQQLLADIYDFLPDATFVVDLEKRVIAWNRAMVEMTGVAREEMLGQGDHAYTIPFYGDRRNQLLDLIDVDDDNLSARYRGITRQGDRLFAEAFCPALYNGKGAHIWAIVSPLYDSDGKRIGTIESVRDITAIKETEANLARSNQELEQFAYVASHDLQEPLRKIAGFTELLANRYKGTFDEKGESYMAYIVDGATRMRSLINDLLGYSRVMRSTRELTDTDCSALLSRVLRDMELAINASTAEITCGPLPHIRADQSQLGQLFQNLIGNAIKYRAAAPPKVVIKAVRQNNDWLFSVTDNGIGIDPMFYDRIFTIFQRLHTRAEYPGTGIGLAICQKIVERHGGRIWVESTVGAGSTFFFTIPVTAKKMEITT
ncbi:MAG: GAF domain-containing protein [Deltaproteobacteria bacterium]|nr:GAF domain-containing protein [Deltaproteobacteria bacterium]